MIAILIVAALVIVVALVVAALVFGALFASGSTPELHELDGFDEAGRR